jgi:hypothetical protein
LTRRVLRAGNAGLHLGPTAATAVSVLQQQGLTFSSRPDSALPRLPEDLTDLGDADLMALFVQLTRWAEYVGTQVAAAEVDEKAAEESLARLRALASIRAEGEKSVTAKKARAYEDADVLAAEEHKRTAYAYRRMVSALYEATDRKAQVISRELTRRVGREPREARRDRWTP